ncbi:MAG TPA: glycosyltransferase, partial [Candidatus Saccharimonadales bacterium]
GRLLRVIGRGPEHDYLTSLAGPSVEFYTDLNDQEVAEALWHAEALISPGVEDFGITAVEALAAGCPVIAIRGGGSKDIIEDNKTGIFFDEQSVKSLESALKTFKSSRFEAADLTAAAEKFSAVRFREKITELISGL